MPFADVGSGIKPSSGAKLFFFEVDGVTPKNTFSDQLASPTPNPNPVESDSNGVFGDIYIDGSYKVTLKDKDSIQIFGGARVDSASGESASSLTTLGLTNSTTEYGSDVAISTSGFTASGDGGSGSWIQNGVTGQTPSQSPVQLGDGLLNDGNGNQWEFYGAAMFSQQLGGILDGVFDNVLVQRAFINWADRTKKNVYLGIGTLLTSDSYRLVDKDGVNLIGLSRYNSILKLAGGVSDSFVTTLRDTNCSIKNLTVDGNGSNQAAGHCVRLQDSANFKASSVELINGNSYGAGLQGGTITGFVLDDFNITGCGLDGVDIKNYNNDNRDITISNGTVSNFGSVLTQQAGIDHRGYVKVSNVTVYLDHDTCRGFRTRNDGAAGSGGEGEYSNIRVENRVGASASVAIGFSHTSPRGKLTVSGLVCVDCSNGLRIDGDGNDGNFSGLTFTNSLGLSGSDQVYILGSRNVISGLKIDGASRYIDIRSGAEQNIISSFRCAGTTTSSAIRIDAGANLNQLAVGLISSQGIVDNSSTTTVTAVTVAAI